MDDWESDVADQPNLVRPYTLTAGRTEARVQLPLEAPIGKLANLIIPGYPGHMPAGLPDAWLAPLRS